MNSRRNALISTAATIVIAILIAVVVSGDSSDALGLPGVVLCVVVALGINFAVYVPSWLLRTEKFYDLTGSITYVVATIVAMSVGRNEEWTSLLLAGLIIVWAARLGSFLFRRIMADGFDRRFDRIKSDPFILLRTWGMQGLWVSLTALAAWTAIASDDGAPFGVLTVVGLVVWMLGFGIEVVADRQKSAFRADPVNEGRFISTGLWAWSRHPNYFGEIVLWSGVALIALPAFDGAEYLALVSPVFVALLLTKVSGVPMLERRGMKKWGDEATYQSYCAAVPVLIMRPPQSDTASS